MNDSRPQFGKYLLLERIGVGGMAEVWKAKAFGAEGFERLVAIKRILPELAEDKDFATMFVDEAKIAVRLAHPNIVAIHELGRADGTLYIAMEYVPGRDLRAIYDFEQRRKGRTPIGIACHVLMKMCEALHHAHFASGPEGEPLQVIHRDVSPQNVLLSFDGEVKVADFGLAKARGRMVQTQQGVVKGKLAYMSPEQLRGEDIDHRVDVFGLGIVLFELVTGKRLFLGSSDLDTLKAVHAAHVPSMRELNPAVEPELEAIVRKALRKKRDERHATALELHDELQSFVYAHDVYCGAAALRSYLREAFPDVAPPLDELPPFASPAPPLKPTIAPLGRARSVSSDPNPGAAPHDASANESDPRAAHSEAPTEPADRASTPATEERPSSEAPRVRSIVPRVVGDSRPPPSPRALDVAKVAGGSAARPAADEPPEERSAMMPPVPSSPVAAHSSSAKAPSARPSPAVVAHRVIATGGERPTPSQPPLEPRVSDVHPIASESRPSSVTPARTRPANVHVEASVPHADAWSDDETTTRTAIDDERDA